MTAQLSLSLSLSGGVVAMNSYSSPSSAAHMRKEEEYNRQDEWKKKIKRWKLSGCVD